MMKKLLCPIICLMLAALMLAVIPTENDCAIYDDTVRLHILANSDTPCDQSTKLYIRDQLLLNYSDCLGECQSTDDARLALDGRLCEIESDVEEWLREVGYDYGVQVTLGTEWYETREYEDFTLPCGYYTSLIITLGEGEGRNWWCVMYPPLCLDLACEQSSTGGYTSSEISLITRNGYNVKFKLLELISEAFCGES